MRWKLFDALCAHPYGIGIHELVDWCYGDDEDGGPDDAVASVRAMIHLLRNDLRKRYPLLTIENRSRSGRKYILVLKRS